jgi:hypothetical protein
MVVVATVDGLPDDSAHDAPDGALEAEVVTPGAGSTFSLDAFDTPDAYPASCADGSTDACPGECTAAVTSVLNVAIPYALSVVIRCAMIGGGGCGATGCGTGASAGGGGGSSAILSNGTIFDVAEGGAGGSATALDGGLEPAGSIGSLATSSLAPAQTATLTVRVGGGGGGNKRIRRRSRAWSR